MFVPVIGPNQQPLMPTTPARARKWIQSGRATPFWKGGIFCIRLNVEPSTREVQPIAVGIDPGSKREAIVSSPRPIPISISRPRPGRESRKRKRTLAACAVLVVIEKRLAVSPGQTGIRARKNCLPLRGHAGSGNCAWPTCSASFFRSVSSW